MLAFATLAVGALGCFALRQQQPLLMRTGNEGYKALVSTDHPQYSIHLMDKSFTDEKSWCEDPAPKYTGYFETPEGFLFFYLFESRSSPEDDPFILWINGGPGCSSALGLFMELGPCRVDPGGNSTSYNPYGWNNRANLLFLDQPIDTGFSYGKPGGKVSDSEQSATEVDIFFQILFSSIRKYANSPLHIFGESYAGHYIPAIGRKIVEENNLAPIKNPNRLHVNIASLGIGNGWVRYTQYDYFADFLADSKYGPLITEQEFNSLKFKYRICEAMSTQCESSPSRLTCVPANAYCEEEFALPKNLHLNPYDIRMPCEPNGDCYTIITDIDTYLNQPWVQRSLGVDREYLGCSAAVGDWFFWTGDGGRRQDTSVATVLENGVKVLVYAGDADYVCNWMGCEAWLNEMEWSGRDEYLEAPKQPFMVGNVEAGVYKTHANLTWLILFESGHMVPYDKPVESLQMLLDWIK